jgi:hypothetical protein
VLAGHTDAVVAAAWSPDGSRIVTASEDGAARIWPLTIGALQRTLRAATTDCLSPEQRQLHLGEAVFAALAGHVACELAQGRRPRTAAFMAAYARSTVPPGPEDSPFMTNVPAKP